MPSPGPGADAGPTRLVEQVARIEHDLATRLHAVSAAAARVRTDDDDEAVHDLRVALRRLDAALQIWRDLLRPRATRRARRSLRTLRRALGPIRELEVNQAQLVTLAHGLATSSRMVVESLWIRLRRRLRRGRQRAVRNARPKVLSGLERRVMRAARIAQGRLQAFPEPRELARRRIATARDAALQAIRPAIEGSDDVRLHAARVAVKKWRYVIESAQPVFGAIAPLKPLRELQRALGAVHDLAMLRELLERRAVKLRNVGLERHGAALTPVIERIDRDHSRAVVQVREAAGNEMFSSWRPAVAEPEVRDDPAPAPESAPETG
ncbi:MAG TPA: CHAD domain-containing protein [Candidatus Limnocylindria bacterium]|nr:CHAD domain-containing protein [Candidatus Limnocylindria bacterium]